MTASPRRTQPENCREARLPEPQQGKPENPAPAPELCVKHFQDLTTHELFAIYKLRTAVFVVEQHCPYQEVDDADQTAWHLWLREGEELLAYLRVLPKDDSGQAFIGRVIAVRRGQGLGARILAEGVRFARDTLGAGSIALSAQSYARGFYEKAGFAAASGEFLEDGIPHIKMTLRIK